MSGTVVSTKMHRTIIIRRDYLHYVPKYNRYEKDTRMLLLMFHQPSEFLKVMLLLLVNVDQFPKLLDLMF